MSSPFRRAVGKVLSPGDIERGRTALARVRGLRTVRFGSPDQPAPICDDIARWSTTQPDAECTQLLPPRSFARRPPHTIESVLPEEYLIRLEASMPERWMVTIPGASLVGRNGLVVLPDGTFVAQSVYGHQTLVEQPEYSDPRARQWKWQPGSWFSLIPLYSHHTTNYFHWIHDGLTWLQGVLEVLPPDTRFAVSPRLSEFHRQTLTALGVPEDRMTPIPPHEIWELETLHFATPPVNSGSARPEVERWLRSAFIDAYGIDDTSATARIYLARRGSAGRQIVNDEEVDRCLRDFGFEAFRPELHSHREQVELFARAEAVVAPHGAGLTNVVFAPSGLKLLEIFTPQMIHHAYVYWTIADALDHEYWFMLAEGIERPGYAWQDMRVPIEPLVATLEQLQLGRR